VLVNYIIILFTGLINFIIIFIYWVKSMEYKWNKSPCTHLFFTIRSNKIWRNILIIDIRMKIEHVHSTRVIYFCTLDKIYICIFFKVKNYHLLCVLKIYTYILRATLTKIILYNILKKNLEHWSQKIKTIFCFLDAIFFFLCLFTDANVSFKFNAIKHIK
jgi:hypothetical protein